MGALLVGASQGSRGDEAVFVVVKSAEVLIVTSLVLTLWTIQRTFRESRPPSEVDEDNSAN